MTLGTVRSTWLELLQLYLGKGDLRPVRVPLAPQFLAAVLLPALAPAFAADDMKKDDGMKKDSMSKDSMKKDDGMKKDSMAKDGMKKDDGMMKKDDGMKK